MFRIMIVDDEPFALSSVAAFVNSQFSGSAQVVTFGNSPDALQSFEDVPADIVITDIIMPNMDGLSLIEQMRKKGHFFVPIIVSGYSEFAYAQKAMQLDVMYYALKPLDFAELQHSITTAMQQIQQQRLLQVRISHPKEQQELFFNDLLSRRILSWETFEERFQLHHFPFSLESSSGIFLRVARTPSADQQYNLITFSNVCENLVRTVLQPQYICTVFRTLNHCDLLLIGTDRCGDDWSELCQRAELLLHLQIELQTLSQFDSLEDFLVRKQEKAALPENDDAEAVNAGSDYHERICLAIAYMEEHYAEDLTRETVSNIVYISESYFSKLFKQETGMGFSDYLAQLRIKKATALLNSNMKIHDVARAVGYRSQNRFLINFKKFTSYTPGEYRRHVLKLLH